MEIKRLWVWVLLGIVSGITSPSLQVGELVKPTGLYYFSYLAGSITAGIFVMLIVAVIYTEIKNGIKNKLIPWLKTPWGVDGSEA